MGAGEDELIRLIQRKKAKPEPRLVPDARITPLSDPLYDLGMSDAEAELQAIGAVPPPPVETTFSGYNGPNAHGGSPVVGAEPLTSEQLLDRIAVALKTARVRYRVKRWSGAGMQYHTNLPVPDFSDAQTHVVPCTKILWSLTRGDREREVVNCALGVVVNAVIPWMPGHIHVSLGRSPCFIMGFSFMAENGALEHVDFPEGYSKG